VIASNEVTIFGSAPAVSNTTVYPYTVTTLGGSCEAASLDGTITVNPEGIITLTSGSGTDTQELCEGDPIDAITYELFDGATDATVTGLPAGVSFSVDVTNIVTISGTPDGVFTTTTVFSYTVTTTGACANTSSSGTITVNPDADLDLISLAGTDTQVTL